MGKQAYDRLDEPNGPGLRTGMVQTEGHSFGIFEWADDEFQQREGITVLNYMTYDCIVVLHRERFITE